MKRADFDFMVKVFENTDLSLTGNFIEDFEKIMQFDSCEFCTMYQYCGKQISNSRLARAGYCRVHNASMFKQFKNN